MAEAGQAVFYSLPESGHHRGELRAAVVTLVKPAFTRKLKGGGTEKHPEACNLTVFGDPSDGLHFLTGVAHVRDVLFDPDGDPGTYCTTRPAAQPAAPDPPADPPAAPDPPADPPAAPPA